MLNDKSYDFMESHEIEDDIWILSSNISNKSIDQEKGNLGFLNNLKRNLSNIKNKIKFNMLKIDFRMDFTEFDKIQIYHNNYDVMCEEVYTEMLRYVKNEIFWISYRSNFDPIIYNSSLFTSDAGWGCMIRSGQMILSKAFYQMEKFFNKYENPSDLFNNIILLFSDSQLKMRNINYNKYFNYFRNTRVNKEENTNIKIKKSFSNEEYEFVTDINYQKDYNSSNIVTPPFSIVNILNTSREKGAGDWFSDLEIINILKCLNEKYQPIENLKIYHFTEGLIKVDQILEKFFQRKFCDCYHLRASYAYDKVEDFILDSEMIKTQDDYVIIDNYSKRNIDNYSNCKCLSNCYNFNNKFYELINPFIIFVSMRLGLHRLEENYYDSIIKFFSIRNNLGMIGGKRSRALYFIGHAEKKLIFLDPHFVQETVNSFDDLSQFETYKPDDFYLLDLYNMTPSITVGFYCCDINDFSNLIDDWKNFTKKKFDDESLNIFEIRNVDLDYKKSTKFISDYFHN